MRILLNSYVDNCPKNLIRFWIFVWFKKHDYLIKKKSQSMLHKDKYDISIQCSKCKRVVKRNNISKRIIDKIISKAL